MDIAVMASIMQHNALRMTVAYSVIKLGMESSTESIDRLVQMMEQSVNPNLGGTIDIRL
jgi:hypothetical protein